MTDSTQGNPKSIWSKLKNTPFLIKLLNWEYWSTGIVYLPVVPMWLYYSLRARTLTFFSAVNPAMRTSGLVLTSKYKILQAMPDYAIPTTIFVRQESKDLQWILAQMLKQEIQFPIIAKPDVGERGMKVEKLDSEEQLLEYINDSKFDFLIQEFITLPREAGILYYRYPDSKKGSITSICLKETLKVEGDGTHSVRELMELSQRAKLQISRFEETKPELLALIPSKGEIIELEPIGNHCRGTMFLDGNHLIDQELTQIFDQISLQTTGLHYGRFDLKYSTLEELKAGKNFKIMELNGINSEPAHIYQPGYSIFRAYKDLFRHWGIIYAISEIQRARGIELMTVWETIKSISQHFSYRRQARA